MSSGAAELDAWVEKIRRLPEMIEKAAPALAVDMHAELSRTIDAGTTPTGEPWPLTKDGRVALRRASSTLTVRASGTLIVATISGRHAIHHYGTKKDPARQVLPVSGMPPTLAKAFRAGMVKRFKETMGAA